jgi:hypothetical protein
MEYLQQKFTLHSAVLRVLITLSLLQTGKLVPPHVEHGGDTGRGCYSVVVITRDFDFQGFPKPRFEPW